MDISAKHRNFTSIAAVLIAFPLLAGGVAARSQAFAASIPNLHFADGERVVGFRFSIGSGRIAGLPKVPIGWNLTVNNDASWNTYITATVEVGAASLEPGFFRKFLVIEKEKSHGLSFDFQGEIDVTKDFEHVRQIKISQEEVAFTAVPKT